MQVKPGAEAVEKDAGPQAEKLSKEGIQPITQDAADKAEGTGHDLAEGIICA